MQGTKASIEHPPITPNEDPTEGIDSNNDLVILPGPPSECTFGKKRKIATPAQESSFAHKVTVGPSIPRAH